MSELSDEELRIYIDRYRNLLSAPPIDEFTGNAVLVNRDIMRAIIAHIDNLNAALKERNRG